VALVAFTTARVLAGLSAAAYFGASSASRRLLLVTLQHVFVRAYICGSISYVESLTQRCGVAVHIFGVVVLCHLLQAASTHDAAAAVCSGATALQ
jgi:hypothetical protein